ncbi:hypothetical protein [Arenicella xantha]|uniref:Uncharacterized protein n=1 Tax=Arenicella xantha TaxID=644221 RepID=A0A395JPL3_9GAMM|nr:hypothetical protein [Arenicella xantha]RBP53283.1 hypothetical protein DFR28_101669 [Arenicella xantha]
MSIETNTSVVWHRIPREPVPDTSALQASILAATQNQSQQSEPQEVRRIWRFPNLIAQRFAAGFAGLAVLSVAFTVMLPSATLLPSAPVASSNGQISLHELEMQELALLEDELLFAQL